MWLRDGLLRVMPLTWYRSRDDFDLTPGYAIGAHPGFERRVNGECLACHSDPLPTRREIVEALLPFLQARIDEGVPLKHMTRHVLGLYQGVPGAKAWRRTLSDPVALRGNDPGLLLKAADELERRLPRAA